MSRRLLLDTGVLIAVERGALSIERVLSENDDVAIAAITVAELMVGGELAEGDHRRRRQALVDDLLSAMPVEPYGQNAARAHARLLAHVRRVGKPRVAHELVIAATAVATGRSVLTADAAANWTDLPHVAAVAVA
ncbi:PIN domain-containing protein [Jiangella rhizosphaerae]|uniref:Ribonuclease VapC n=1 Tax=Jiangella rhizosphaerae TaxID=2293569 RepID=A0A418KV32_9ACTN|nr:PIN domain-containing protein [Jiangella rhizosphaerae]RIQ33696.1 VapC toxin family PIN domain ribonuclease [Jiangella rhizosphaerae]